MPSPSSSPPPSTGRAPRNRQEEEYVLCFGLVHTVLASAREVYDHYWATPAALRPPCDNPMGVTRTEFEALQRYHYYDWIRGSVAGLVVLGSLVGGRHLWKKRVLRGSVRAPPRLLSSEQAILSNAPPVRSTNAPAPPPIWDQVAWEVQAIGLAVVTCMTSLVVAKWNYNYLAFYQKLATLPLQPGTSDLCQRMCPALLHHVQSSSSDQTEQYWKDPVTPELEQMRRLVYHCELRVAYQDQLRQEQGLGPDEDVEIPEPGVPLQYQYK